MTKSSYRSRAQIIIINHFALYLAILHIKPFLFIKIVNNSPQVNEKGVLERMGITLQCWVVLERVSVLNHFPHSLCLYFVLMLVRAENPLSHKYVVAKGISVLTADMPRQDTLSAALS